MTEAMMTETTMESIMDGLETDDLADDRWTPDSDQQADWCLRKIREAQEDKARWKEFYQEQMRRAEEKADRTIGFMQDALLRYFRQVPHKETKTTEKYALPSGELVYTKAKVDYVRDDDAILAWAKESHPEFVKVEESVRWADLKKTLITMGDGEDVAMKDTGEIVAGIKAEMSTPGFKATVK